MEGTKGGEKTMSLMHLTFLTLTFSPSLKTRSFTDQEDLKGRFRAEGKREATRTVNVT